MSRRWWVLAAVTLSFFFLNAATFASLGVALYSMIQDLHWSHAAAGFGFSLLGISCGLTSAFPPMLVRRIGARWTVVLGCVLLALGFVLTYAVQSLTGYYAAMILLGAGFSLSGNVPAIWLISAWFPTTMPRVVGFYLMMGAAGTIVGPPLVQSIIQYAGGWRIHWLAMAVVAAMIGVFSYFSVRDQRAREEKQPPAQPDATKDQGSTSPWTYRSAIRTRQFILVAASLSLNMACVTTIHSVAVSHLKLLGSEPATAALALSVMALVTTITKGVAGPICERASTERILGLGTALQAVGVIIFALAHTGTAVFSFAVIFGAGWGFAYLAANVLLLQYFGRDLGTQLLGLCFTISTLAAVGPIVAGATADQFGTFAPVFYVFAALLGIVALPIAIMETPSRAPEREAGALT